MKINVTSVMEVEISESEQKNICLDYLYKSFNWKPQFKIVDEQIIETVVMGGSHSWYDIRVIRQAEEKDYFVAGVLNLINSTKKSS
jgi:hypothetical protein